MKEPVALSVGNVFHALAEPVRRQLVEMLADEGPKTATELARLYPITRQGILKHLHVLQEADLVRVRRHGRDKRYELSPQPLAEVANWTERVGTRLEERLHRLKDMLENET